jgi:hypothetical protein
VKEYDGLAVGIAGQLPVEPVAVADVEHPRLIGFDRRI